MALSQLSNNVTYTQTMDKKKSKSSLIFLCIFIPVLVLLFALILVKYVFLIEMKGITIPSLTENTLQEAQVSITPSEKSNISNNFNLCEFNNRYLSVSYTVKITETGVYLIQMNKDDESICKVLLLDFKASGIPALQIISLQNIRHIGSQYDFLTTIHTFVAYFIHGDVLYLINAVTNEVNQIPLHPGAYGYRVYPAGYTYADDKMYRLLVIAPDTFVGGCEDDDTCDGLRKAISEDGKRTDVDIYLVRTDGAFITIPRSSLSNVDFNNIVTRVKDINNHEDERVYFYSNSTSVIKSFPVSELKKDNSQ